MSSLRFLVIVLVLANNSSSTLSKITMGLHGVHLKLGVIHVS